MGEEEKLIPEENLYIYDDINNLSYTIMGKIDLNQPDKEFLLKGYSGLGGEVYVSKDNIYVATFDSYANYETNLLGWAKVSEKYLPQTRIIKFSLDSLEQKAAARVDG
ncbi:MAG: beta-propeller domain-containing protein [Bacillota bacterium]|mgnify:CR=1 FL=1|jgi:inhibitor of cysteine peptidase|nr:beta-propeller domain-containing protein [Bacillota bacterium]HHU43711.1 hypothetical protein [Clostridiales bacterium]